MSMFQLFLFKKSSKTGISGPWCGQDVSDIGLLKVLVSAQHFLDLLLPCKVDRGCSTSGLTNLTAHILFNWHCKYSKSQTNSVIKEIKFREQSFTFENTSGQFSVCISYHFHNKHKKLLYDILGGRNDVVLTLINARDIPMSCPQVCVVHNMYCVQLRMLSCRCL